MRATNHPAAVHPGESRATDAGDAWLKKGANLILFGIPGGGDVHLAAAFGRALVAPSAVIRTPKMSREADSADGFALGYRTVVARSALRNFAASAMRFRAGLQ